MMRGLLMLSLGASVCVFQTPFENKMTVHDNMQIKVAEAEKKASVAIDELFTATQVPTKFKEGLANLTFGAFEAATTGTPMKPTRATNPGAVDEVANFVLGLYTKEGTSRAVILDAIVVLFKKILSGHLDRLNTAQSNALLEADPSVQTIVDDIATDLNNDIASTVTGDALTTQRTANAKSAKKTKLNK